jgi:hypothetical protein
MKLDEEKFQSVKNSSPSGLETPQKAITNLSLNSLPANLVHAMTTRLKVQSLEDRTEIDIVITYDGNKLEKRAPAVVISHPYGPLG